LIGHFRIKAITKAGILLDEKATQFIVLEVKMSSPLSKGVVNAPNYDQASRTIA
jgi:hypothetical protein